MVKATDGSTPGKLNPEQIAYKHIERSDIAIAQAGVKVENAQASLNELKADFKKSSRLSVGVFSLSLILGGAAYYFGTVEPEKNQSTIQSLQKKADTRCVEVGKMDKLSDTERATCSKVTYLEEMKSEQQKNTIGLFGSVLGMLGALSLSIRFEKQARVQKDMLNDSGSILQSRKEELAKAYGRHAVANEILHDLANNK